MKIICESKLLRFFDIGSRVEKINLARKKFMLQFIMGIILSKNVNFSAVAEHFSPDVELKSHIRRMERFFNDYQLDYIQIAILLKCFLPPGQINLSIDRTNWQFAGQNINFLTISAYCKGVGIPLLFELLDKKGNSKTNEREQLFKKLFRIVAPKQIATFCADREFIGEKWYKFLIKYKISFYIRIKSNHLITLNGMVIQAKYLATIGREKVYKNIRIHGLTLHLATKRISLKKEEEEKYLLVLTNAIVEKALKIYRLRWSIEVFFQSIKNRGFKLENTHLTNLPKLKKLFALVSLAFASCLDIGVWKHDYKKPMKKKKNGYKPNSFFRYGLDEIRRALLHLHQKKELTLEIIDNIYRKLCDNLDLWNSLNFILRL